MIRSCKHIDIKDLNTIKPWVLDCISRHYNRRYDFRNLMKRYGYIDKKDYIENLESWDNAINKLCKDIICMISNRKLNIPKVKIEERIDKNSGKIRMIGCESALQECFDYIAVFSCQEIWNRKIVIQQCSSLPNRGQKMAKNMILKKIKKDIARREYAQRHKIHYIQKYKYHAKTDIKKMFPSGRYEYFIRDFKRDCANEDIIWLWENLLASHRVNNYKGFMIGAITSQYAMLYIMSNAWRFIMSQDSITACEMYMDDFVIQSNNKKKLKISIFKLIKYLKDNYDLDIKDNWFISNTKYSFIDFVGFRIYGNGKVTLRPRNWKKIRHLLIQKSLSLKQSRRLLSFHGLIKNSDSYNIIINYKYYDIIRRAKCILRKQSRKLCQAC